MGRGPQISLQVYLPQKYHHPEPGGVTAPKPLSCFGLVRKATSVNRKAPHTHSHLPPIMPLLLGFTPPLPPSITLCICGASPAWVMGETHSSQIGRYRLCKLDGALQVSPSELRAPQGHRSRNLCLLFYDSGLAVAYACLSVCVQTQCWCKTPADN